MPGDPALTTGASSQMDSSPSSHLYAVALKLPVFWPDSCESWFINAESQFHLKNITSSITKFHHVVASLPQNEIDNVVDIIRNPPAADPYGVLRSRLLQTHSLTDYARCESIMSLPLSGDMLPSALLSRMRALLPSEHQECLFLRQAAFLSTPKCVSELLGEFHDVLQSDGFTASPPRHKVRHHILTNPGPPIFAKARRLDPDKLAAAKAEFSAMEKSGIIRRSTSPWASPLHMVKKKDGGWRPCRDYHRLNTTTVPDSYPFPNIADFSSGVSGSTVFSKLHLQKGYYQVPVDQKDIQKTDIITSFGMFELETHFNA